MKIFTCSVYIIYIYIYLTEEEKNYRIFEALEKLKKQRRKVARKQQIEFFCADSIKIITERN